MSKTDRPYGLWPSPLTPASMSLGLRLADVQWDSDGHTLVWLEPRSGQGVLVAQGMGSDAPRDLTEAQNVRAFLGYGGGEFAVQDHYVYYADGESKRLFRMPLSQGDPRPITPAIGAAAAPTPSPDGRWLVYVYSFEGEDGLAIVDAEGKRWPAKLATGADFYMQPAWHPNGKRLAWIEWDHPHMPWDATRLKMADLTAMGSGCPAIVEARVLAEGEDVAIAEPAFSADGRYLVYICDRSGYRNLYRFDVLTGDQIQLVSDRADIGGPAWTQGRRSYAILPDDRIAYIRTHNGADSIWIVPLKGGDPAPLVSPLARYPSIAQIAAAPDGSRIACIASAPDTPARVVSLNMSSSRGERVHAHSTAERVPSASLSRPEPVSWNAPDKTTVHGIWYPPHSPTHASAGLPPAIVMIHGGPTSQVSLGYDSRAQFLATRGYGVLEVDYRGSTGHGKEYVRALRGNWGIADVEDAVGGARFLADSGRADPERLVIMGGSAGGFTVWQCLVQHPGLFRAAACLYGVSNLFTLAADTHKFEERYLDSLLGPLPQASAIYRERSAIFDADKIVDPVAVFQGDIDRVVPRAQSDTIVASLRARGVPHVYHVYEGEGHGWRKADTIERFYNDLLAFLREHVVFA